MPCANPDCSCDNAVAFVELGEHYCGPYCLRTGDEGRGVRCACGHFGCLEEAQTRASEPGTADA